jgi:hypothetical protein
MTASEYIAKADRICARVRRKARAELGPLAERVQEDGKPTRKEVILLSERGAELSRPLLRELEALPKPADKREAIEAYLKVNRQTLEAVDRAVASYKAGDSEATASHLQRNRELAFAATNAAMAVRFKECGTEYQQ